MAKLRQRKSDTSSKGSKGEPSPQIDTPPKSLISPADIKKEFSPTGRSVPDILYAEDGQTFYPCKYCCRAFANQPDLNQHSSVCAGGRGSPSPFTKPCSNKENLTAGDEEVNNNQGLSGTPKAKGRKRKTVANNEKKVEVQKILVGKKRKMVEVDKRRRARASSPDCDTNVISTESVGENINNLTEEMKETVLKNINQVLQNSKVSVVARKDGPIVVQVAENGDQPALEISSRNIDDHCVEIKTRKNGTRLPNEQLPDISRILEINFGNVKPRRPDYIPPEPSISTEIPVEVKPNVTSPKCPNPLNQESVADEEEMEEMVINTEELEDAAAIVLEDLDIHICKQCGAVYHTLEDLVNHDKYEHRNVKKRYPPSELEKYHKLFKSAEDNICPICGKTLSSKAVWPRHLQTHSVVLNFECEICKRKFTRDDHRKNHEKRHMFGLKTEGEN